MGDKPYRNMKTERWLWMMSYCEKYRLSPADSSNWEHARRKWEEHRKKLESEGSDDQA